MAQQLQSPRAQSYDVILIGGAMYGSSIAWWLSRDPGFDGSILLVERDLSFEFAATSHTNSCIRQQFSNTTNIQISQFGAEFINNFQSYFDHDPRVPHIPIQSFGYMYLANTAADAENLRQSQVVQAQLGAGTRHMTAAEIQAEYPFYNVDDITAGNHNTANEGYFDGGTIFDWYKRVAQEKGAEYVQNEVVAINRHADRIHSVTLASGETLSCGLLVNCTGPRGAHTARMAGIDLPVEPRKRYSFIFDAEQPLDRDLPLTIDPSGVHMRSEGRYYLAGCPPDDDAPVAYDDFNQDHSIWQEKVWPILAARVPKFEAIKLINSWAGHYDYNTFDQNAIIGQHHEVENFLFANGFSGHGLQQSMAIGRGLAEFITYGAYRSIDLSPFAYKRIAEGNPLVEKAVI
ncbi:MAG: FAD-binding oxidoreductase [Rhodobacteraceae bacterium]|jgi:glycine/D-amino acid oxidase-like deaminating enzyme|nr:FAD-binding oxidoreductase [Paracoccaceae bacterium]